MYRNSEEYKGERKKVQLTAENPHLPRQLITATEEIELVLDLLEGGMGFRKVTTHLNLFREDKARLAGIPPCPVGMTCVYDLHWRSKLLIQRPEIAKQGSQVSTPFNCCR